MKVLIIENESLAADKLKKILFSIDSNIEVVGTTETVEGTLNWIQSNPTPDLIILDIQLDDGICFEIFETIKIDTPIIFTTAYDEYMLKAFKVNSVDYLLKPIQEEDLKVALQKFKDCHFSMPKVYLEKLLGEVSRQYKSRFLVKVGSNYKSISVGAITCFYTLEKGVFLKTNEDRDYALDYSLDKLTKLVNPSEFFRINRNCLISINAINSMISYSSHRLKIKLEFRDSTIMDDFLIVSRDKIREFKKWID